MTLSLKLEPVREARFDLELALLDGGRLVRIASATYLQSDRGIHEITRRLALAGVRATACSSVPMPARELRPAIAFDLEPLDGVLGIVDTIEVRHIAVREASAVLLRRRLPWRGVSRARSELLQRLLRGEEDLLAWRRIVWCPPDALHVARRRIRLRPVVFDRAAVGRAPARWTHASKDAVARWAFA